jgi:tetratricopeptide (TPR) repeat protein
MMLIESSPQAGPRVGRRRISCGPIPRLIICLGICIGAGTYAGAAAADPAETDPRLASGPAAVIEDAEPVAAVAPDPAAVDADNDPGAIAADRDGAAEAGVNADAEAVDVAGPISLEELLGGPEDPLTRVEEQIQTREYDTALRWLEDHIDTVENGSHRYERELIRPLTLLGDAYAGKGEYATALGHYQRATHLSRVNDGLNSPAQVEIVYREANALKALGDFRQANDREEYAYHVLTRHHDPMDEQLLPGIYHLANWYERTSNVFAARSLYQHAVAIISANDKLDTPEAIPAFQGLASSYRLERFPAFARNESSGASSGTTISTSTTGTVGQQISVNNFPAGEAALQRIVRIRQSQQPFDQMALAEAVLDLADWYMLFDKTQRSVPLYAHAWELMESIDGFDVASRFAEPELLYFPRPDDPSVPSAAERGALDTGYVEVAFDVTDTGYVRGLTTVGSLPDGLMDFRVRKSLRVARYRPMLVDGVPVAKQAHTYRYEFPYYQDRSEDREAERADDANTTASRATGSG